MQSSKTKPALLQIKDLYGFYGESEILHGVNLELNTGEVATLLGRNGVGKSTTLKAVMGVLKRRTGSVVINGQETIGMRSDEIARVGVGFCPEDRGIFASLTAEENLRLPPKLQSGGLLDEEVLSLFPSLSKRMASRGSWLSGGEQQMLAIGRILRTGAKLLLLDEPAEGLAPTIIQKIGSVIRQLRDWGATILLVEQNFRFAATVSDYHYVMENGVIVDKILNAAIKKEESKLLRYLGV
jgi:branched-chain amino acid transport system ATP-binding protein